MRDRPVFIHISKNAGTSIIRSAGEDIVATGHCPALEWVSEHGRDSTLFAVIRNPYNRVFSEYCYRKNRYNQGERTAHLARMDRPFNDWVLATFRDGEFRTREFFEETGVEFLEPRMIDGSLIWFLPQMRWICDEKGRLLVRELLLFETLDKDWQRFCRTYGINRQLQHLNAASGVGKSLDQYSRASRDLIADYYAADFEAFGYAR